MGKLDKHKKTKGPWGNRLIRTTQTYGKNLDRVIDQNSLIDDIEKNYIDTDGTGLPSAIETSTGAVLKKAVVKEMTNGEIKASIIAGGTTSCITLLDPVPGKTLIPQLVVLNVKNGATAETGNRLVNIGYISAANMVAGAVGPQGLTAKGVFNGVAANKEYQIAIRDNSLTSYFQFENANTALTTNDKAIGMWFDAAPNGDWYVTGGLILYYEIDGTI